MQNKNPLALGIAFGIAVGSVIGVLKNNIGLWIPVAIAIGAGIGGTIEKNNRYDNQGGWCKRPNWKTISRAKKSKIHELLAKNINSVK